MSDIEKAIESLKNIVEYWTYRPSEVEAAKLAISALEKQVAKKPILEDNGGYPEYYEHWLECPECGEAIPEYTAENNTWCYCLGCGQKLDWSEVENE